MYKGKRKSWRKFEFTKVSCNDIIKHLKNLNVNKGTGSDNIPAEILKLAVHILDKPLTTTINQSIQGINSPMEAKVAAVTAILKSDEKIDKRNYRPVSIQNSIPKILENVIKEQLVPYFDNFD